ncbi:MAG: glycosyltransferase family 4 protein [Pseudomonadota bacterium]
MNHPSLAFAEDALPYLVDDADYPTGGWAVELLGWFEGFNALNRSVVLTWDGANEIAGSQSAVEFIEAWSPQRDTGGWRYFRRFVPAVSNALRENDIDVMVQACAGLATLLYGLAARQAGKKFVYRVVNDIDVDDRIKQRLKPYQYYAYQFALRMADAFVCQNDYQAQKLKQRFPKTPQFTLHNPYKALAEPEAQAETTPYVAWLGVFSEQKNLPLLLTLARTTPDVEFRVAGMPAKLADTITLDAFDQLKTLDNVNYVGFTKRTQVPTFLHNARALVNTSHYEGFSNTFLESLAVGTPIITSVGVDPDHIVANNALGFVVNGVDEYRDAIREVTRADTDDYTERMARCRAFVETHHAPTTQATQFLTELSAALDL